MQCLDDAICRLRLTLNPKSSYQPWQRGVDFCGYRIWPTHILPRKRNVKRWRLRLRQLAEDYRRGRAAMSDVRQAVSSCIAYHSHASAHRTLAGVLDDAIFTRNARHADY
jgi:hypothetical protein